MHQPISALSKNNKNEDLKVICRAIAHLCGIVTTSEYQQRNMQRQYNQSLEVLVPI